jgi:hypothetical protein
MKGRWKLAFFGIGLMLVAFIGLPAIAYAQDAAPEVAAKGSAAVEYAKSAVDPLVDTLALLLSTVFISLLGVGLAWLKKKWNIDAGESVEKALQSIIERGIGYAAEKAHKALQAGEDAPGGAQKLRDALEYVEDEVQRLGYDKLAADKLKALIESRLGVERVKGTLPTAEAKKEG